jgi:MFS family permease
MIDTPQQKIPIRTQAAVYTIAVCTQGTTALMGVIVPLWVFQLSASPFMIGAVLSASTVLPLLLSIHGGALIDRLGAKRVLMFFAIIMALIPIGYPLAPWLPAVVALQLFFGLASSMGWIGAQAMIGQVMGSAPLYAGRLSFAVRIGVLSGPPLAGLAWDFIGPWGAFLLATSFGCLMMIAVANVPITRAKLAGEEQKTTLRELVPSWQDYVGAFALLAIPAVLMIILVSTVRITSNHIQSTFYVVFLESTGLTATLIGLTITAVAGCGLFSTLAVAPMARRVNPAWLLFWVTIISTILMAIVPLLSLYFLLIIVSGLRGIALGVAQPLLISILGNACERGDQGKAVGLRTTINRAAQTLLPLVMGSIAEAVGLENSFYIIGGSLLIFMMGIAIYMLRTPASTGKAT